MTRRGWTEGDVWTVGVGAVLAVALAVPTIPAALDARDRQTVRAARPALPPALVAPRPPQPVVPSAPVTQPLLDPLVPLARPAPSPSPAPTLSPSAAPRVGPAPLQPGGVREFATMEGGRPGGVAASADGTVHAATDAGSGPSQLHSWDAAGARAGRADVPEQPDGRTRGVTGLAAVGDGSVLAVDAASARVLRYDPRAGTWAVLARLPDLVTCLLPIDTDCQPGLTDTAPLPRGIAVDVDGTAYISDAGQGTVWRLRPGRPIESWYASADLLGPEGLAGLALDGDGHLLAVVTRLSGLQATGEGALLRIQRAADGGAGGRSVVATFASGDDPMDVAVGAEGSLFVPLRGAQALVVLDEAGSEVLRVVHDALQAPTSVELVAGRVYVCVGGTRPAVLVVGTLERPVAPRRSS